MKRIKNFFVKKLFRIKERIREKKEKRELENILGYKLWYLCNDMLEMLSGEEYGLLLKNNLLYYDVELKKIRYLYSNSSLYKDIC